MDNSSYLAVVEKIALECSYRMMNGDITREQYDGAVAQAAPIMWPSSAGAVTDGGEYDRLFGLPVIPTHTGYKLFVRCDYCGVRQPPIKQDGISVCAKCGAPIE